MHNKTIFLYKSVGTDGESDDPERSGRGEKFDKILHENRKRNYRYDMILLIPGIGLWYKICTKNHPPARPEVYDVLRSIPFKGRLRPADTVNSTHHPLPNPPPPPPTTTTITLPPHSIATGARVCRWKPHQRRRTTGERGSRRPGSSHQGRRKQQRRQHKGRRSRTARARIVGDRGSRHRLSDWGGA